MKSVALTYQAVPLYSLTQSIVVVCFQQQAVRHVLDEVQVFVCRNSLVPLFRGSPSLIGGAFQVVFNMHGDYPGKKIVHHYNADVLAACLDAVQSVELGQQGPLVLVYVLEGRKAFINKLGSIQVSILSFHTYHEVSRQKLLKKLSLFVLNGLDDELVVARNIEDGAACSGVRQLDQRLIAQRVLQDREKHFNLSSRKIWKQE